MPRARSAGVAVAGDGAAGQPLADRPGGAAGVTDRQRQRPPGQRATELDDRRGHRRGLQHRRRRAVSHRSVAGQVDHPVGVLHHALEPVFGQHHRDAEVVHEAGHGGEHLLGRGGIERRGGLVENEHARMSGEHRTDRDALLLAAGQLVQGSRAELGQAEEVEGLLDALAHHLRRHGQLLHAVGQLLLDGVCDEPGQRILPDDPDDVGELARRVLCGRPAVDGDPAGQRSAGEVRNQAVDGPEQRRLARPGAPDDEAQLALVHVQGDVAQHRARGVGVGDRHAVEVDHAATRSRAT
jgi:hypothetical protein